ncbi:unnamed protein product [Phyllotreta striolata]|uniref:Transport and Golgi organization protein 2 n=1 Tax=Phyllotreta striolata TaxID=444603 RepID=A0A9N9TNB4_PHYSR|nr:unnamed protein product [Phyllotreta striolata]
MCILFVHVDPSPCKGGYRLVVATNRDEYYNRPSAKAQIDPQTNIIGGKDMQPGKEGGTWLAFRSKDQENGKDQKHCVGVLLNLTGVVVENSTGRGTIITDYLTSSLSYPQYCEVLDRTNYGGYNFVSIELSKEESVTYQHSNIPKITSSYMGKHTMGFGNSPIFNPLYKVRGGRNRFEEIIEKHLTKECLEQALLELLKDGNTKYLPDDELQRRQPLAFENLSSIFIEIDPPGYGTRTHTLIFIDYDWNLSFIEYTMTEPINIKNPEWTESRIELKL